MFSDWSDWSDGSDWSDQSDKSENPNKKIKTLYNYDKRMDLLERV